MNLEELFALDVPRPEIILHVNGKQMTFLCDSGACRTTCREHIPGAPPIQNTLQVRSATGNATTVNEVGPVWIRDPEGNSVNMTVISMTQCPVNLLGRDGLLQLKLALIPTADNRLAIKRLGTESECFVVQGTAEPHYYYSLDISDNPPLRTGTALITKAENTLSHAEDIMPPDQLHVTMYYRQVPKPEPSYWRKLEQLSPATLTLDYLYTDQESNAAAGVKLGTELEKLFFNPTVPHVSVCKTRTKKWKDLGRMVQSGQMQRDWVTTGPGTWYSKSAGLTRIALFWTVKAKATVHLQDPNKRT